MKIRGSGFEDLYRLQKLARKDPDRALREACREFEALFLENILRGLDRTVMRSGFFPESLESKIYRDLYYQELAREISGQGLGIAEMLYQELSQRSELKPPLENTEKGGRTWPRKP